MFAKSTSLLLAVLALTVIAACSGGGNAEGEIDPARLPSPPAEPPTRAAAAHILIAYQGAFRAAEEITRTKEEALALATTLCDSARTRGVDFAGLALRHSDGPSAPRGGSLGVFEPGRMVKAFEDAAFGMGEGQVSDVVETQFGYHVIVRQKIDEITASHILIQYSGAARASVERTQEEATALAEEVLAKCQAEGADFAALATEYSDGPSGPAGGSLGTFSRGQMVGPFEDAAFALEPGEVSGIVETPFGYHIIMRAAAE